MICGRKDHLLPIGQDHRLQHVYYLCDVRHLHSVAMIVEYIQVYAGHQCVTHCVLLIKESGIRARFNIVPGTPFIYYQPDFLFRIITIHDG